jgi:hypothetical protein
LLIRPDFEIDRFTGRRLAADLDGAAVVEFGFIDGNRWCSTAPCCPAGGTISTPTAVLTPKNITIAAKSDGTIPTLFFISSLL